MWRKNLDLTQTIFSLATGSLPSAIAVVRLSGPDAFKIAASLFHPQGGHPLERKRATQYGTLHDNNGKEIDNILLLGFTNPRSFSGEDTVEFHCHGSKAVIEQLNGSLTKLGARQAVRGEFSYRAYLNGKLTVQSLENLGDVFQAHSGVDLERIYSRRDGSIQAAVGMLREKMLEVQAILDTAIDFSDEYSTVIQSAYSPLQELIRECSEIAQRYSVFGHGTPTPRVVLAGLPNAGKSSLFNAILCRHRALVDKEPGTTRDVLEEDIELDGRSWKIVDTAGRGSHEQGEIEKRGVELGEDFLASSRYWILVVDGTCSLAAGDSQLLEQYGSIPHTIVWNKQDLPAWKRPDTVRLGTEKVVCASARSGQNVSGLLEVLRSELASVPDGSDQPLPTAIQSERLLRAEDELVRLQDELEKGLPPEYLAERGRSALSLLDVVVGEIDTEVILDRVFARFCIGK